MTSYRTINEIEEEYLRNHPDELDDYIAILFDEYADYGDTASLMRSLNLVSQVKGLAKIADFNHPTANSPEKSLPEKSITQLVNINNLLKAMGYRLAPQKIPEALYSTEQLYKTTHP